MIGLGPHADLDYYGHKLFPGVVDLALEGTERASEGQAFEIRARAPAHPILEGLSLAVGSPLTQSRLTAVSKGRITSSRAEAIVTTTGGLPVVVAAQQVSIFLGSFSDDWGDLPYSGAFVPLVRGLVDHAARAASLESGDLSLVGRPPTAHLDTAPPGAVVVRGPESYRSQATVASDGSGFRAVADAPAPVPGFYVFEAGGREAAVAAVNPDPIESDLRPVSMESLQAGSPDPPRSILTVRSLRTHLRDMRQGRELWLLFLVLAAVALAGELALASARTVAP